MIIVKANGNCKAEKEYILQQILSEYLGLTFEFREDNTVNGIELLRDGKKIILADTFFELVSVHGWLSGNTLPILPLNWVETNGLKGFVVTTANTLPVLYGENNFRLADTFIEFGMDIFGSCFFMLSRYEELINRTRDHHGRFPAEESLAFKEGFIRRPVVDEYTALLMAGITQLWPDIEMPPTKPRLYISCDVDFLYDKGVRFPGIIKRVMGDILKRKSVSKTFASLVNFWKVSILRNHAHDPFNTFEFMMDACERKKLKMAFYFIPRDDKLPIDGDYDINSVEVQELFRKIMARGHEVGYHASYESYRDPEITKEEVKLLREAYEKAGGLPSEIKGGRQHYLRWETGITEKNWEEAGLSYDSSLGYAEHIGYRCGTGREYSFYDSVNRRRSSLTIRPLVVMEVSLLNKQYMNLSVKDALEEIISLWEHTVGLGGAMSLLWHNTSFNSREERKLFEDVLNRISPL